MQYQAAKHIIRKCPVKKHISYQQNTRKSRSGLIVRQVIKLHLGVWEVYLNPGLISIIILWLWKKPTETDEPLARYVWFPLILTRPFCCGALGRGRLAVCSDFVTCLHPQAGSEHELANSRWKATEECIEWLYGRSKLDQLTKNVFMRKAWGTFKGCADLRSSLPERNRQTE